MAKITYSNFIVTRRTIRRIQIEIKSLSKKTIMNEPISGGGNNTKSQKVCIEELWKPRNMILYSYNWGNCVSKSEKAFFLFIERWARIIFQDSRLRAIWSTTVFAFWKKNFVLFCHFLHICSLCDLSCRIVLRKRN